MSVLDQLRALEREVQQRLRELRPLVAEYRDLEKVAERLGLKRDEDEPAQTPAAKPAAARQEQGEALASSGAQARGGEANCGEARRDGASLQARGRGQAEAGGRERPRREAQAGAPACGGRARATRAGRAAAGARTARDHGGRTRR